MNQEERRQEILDCIRGSDTPVSGTWLAGKCGVSRQIIVQDIAALRAAGYDILSTNKGYICRIPAQAEQVFKVRHTDQQIEDELNLIVDNGGIVLDVFVDHEVYGKIRADLNVSSRRKVAEFLQEIHAGKSSPLKNITSGIHFHTVRAYSEETLEHIRQELEARGYLME